MKTAQKRILYLVALVALVAIARGSSDALATPPGPPVNIQAAQPTGTPQPVSGYPVIGTCTRTIVYSANTSTTSGTLSAGRYVLTPSAQAWFRPVLTGGSVTTVNGMRIGDVAGAPVQFFVDASTQDRIAIITSSGGGTFNLCAETY